MTTYRITSKAGQDYGLWTGATPREAFEAMIAEAGGRYGDETTGTEEDWVIEPAAKAA